MIISAPFRETNPRLRGIGTIVGLGLFVLLAALWRVQVMHGEHYDNKQDAQSLRRIRIPAARGQIWSGRTGTAARRFSAIPGP